MTQIRVVVKVSLSILLIFLVQSPLSFSYTPIEPPSHSHPLPSTSFSISSYPEGAHIFIDSIAIGQTTPAEIYIMPGYHELKLQLSGYEIYTNVVHIDGPSSASFRLIPISAKAIKPVKVNFSSNINNATIWIDGSDTGKLTPSSILFNTPGIYKIKFSSEDYENESKFNITKNETIYVMLTPRMQSTQMNEEYYIAILSIIIATFSAIIKYFFKRNDEFVISGSRSKDDIKKQRD